VRLNRRRLLHCAAVLLAVAALPAVPARRSFADADAEWSRLQRGLSQETMAGCRKAAARLTPRLGTLLKGEQWESQMLKAVADELKQAGVYPDHPATPGPGCSVEASTGADAAVTLPGIGPVIAAVLAVVAAVLVIIAQTMAKGLEEQAAAKERDDQAAKVKKLQRKTTDEVARRDDCVLFGKKPD
jgi:hypothetical protein